jgi:hypothetical protein
MSEKRDMLGEMIESLKQQRDELALQMHLGKAEAKEEWERVQERLDKLSDDFEPVKDAMGESAEGLLTSLSLVAEEIKESFRRIRKAL